MQDITAYSCVICDPEGGHPKPSMKVLQQHMLDQHHRQYCKVCVEVCPLDTALSLSRHYQILFCPAFRLPDVSSALKSDMLRA